MFVWMTRRRSPGGRILRERPRPRHRSGSRKRPPGPGATCYPAIPARKPARVGSLDCGFLASAPKELRASCGCWDRSRTKGRPLDAEAPPRSHAEDHGEDDHAGQGGQEAGHPENRTQPTPSTTVGAYSGDAGRLIGRPRDTDAKPNQRDVEGQRDGKEYHADREQRRGTSVSRTTLRRWSRPRCRWSSSRSRSAD